MNNAVVGILSFVSGAAIAAFVTYKIVDKKTEEKYDALFQEELASVKEKFTVPKNPIKAFLEEKGDTKVDVILAEKVSLHNAQRIPFTLLAAIEIPIPVPQITIPRSHLPSATAFAARAP